MNPPSHVYRGHLRLRRRCWIEATAETLAEGRARLPEGFPKASARRMSHLATLFARLLDELRPQPGDAVVLVTTWSENRSLEAYLDSFPHPSPTLFQTSIHPAPVQGACVPRQAEVGELWPLVGDSLGLGRALDLADLCPAARVIVLAGEEVGGWLQPLGLASSEAWACGLELARTNDAGGGSLARIDAAAVREAGATPGTGAEAFRALATGERGMAATADGGAWAWRWMS